MKRTLLLPLLLLAAVVTFSSCYPYGYGPGYGHGRGGGYHHGHGGYGHHGGHRHY